MTGNKNISAGLAALFATAAEFAAGILMIVPVRRHFKYYRRRFYYLEYS